MTGRHPQLLQLLVLAAFLFPTQAFAWDYLEHEWFTDAACDKAQTMLAAQLEETGDESLIERYIALGLFCPVDDTATYCVDGQKVTRGAVTLLDGDPAENGEYSITLGDIAALPDHISRFGPVKGIANAQDDGLILRTLEWLSWPGGATGVIEDVAEDACETELADFKGAKADILMSYTAIQKHDGFEAVPQKLLLPGLRTPPNKGPEDPTTLWSFNNPHYLDLVIRNHTHFGEHAYGAWIGFHSAATRVSRMQCEDLIPSDPEIMAALADETSFKDVDWDELGPNYGHTACAMLAEQLRGRMAFWAKAAPQRVTPKVREFITRMDPQQSNRVIVQLLSLVFEGSGIHFLQDGLASGHMRTIRSREALSAVRYDHDLDNARGVVANLDTRSGEHTFWAWGDTYLLSKSPEIGCSMDWAMLGQVAFPIADIMTACSIRHQRGILSASTAASLMDWALGGPAFEDARCGTIDTAVGWICKTLPLRATLVAGSNIPVHQGAALQYGTLPIPPPEYSYESLSVRVGLDIPDNITQLGVKLSFLEQLDYTGHWMTSYRFGLHTTLGDHDKNQWVLDGSYQFHYRLSARGMLEAGPFLFGGLRDPNSPSFFAGVGPSFGMAFLPEGWSKIPLEISITYRLPLVMFSSQNGFFHDDVIDGHWLQLGVGLAYSH